MKKIKMEKSFSKAYKTKLDVMNAEREFLNSKVEFGGDMDTTFVLLTTNISNFKKIKFEENNGNIFKRRRYFTDFENVKLKDMDGNHIINSNKIYGINLLNVLLEIMFKPLEKLFLIGE
ncbi:MAG: hypothetical protein V8Q71_01465 [Bacilli bacterium]